jgi:chaperone modulatory protein CbpM
MAKNIIKIYEGRLLEEEQELSFVQFCKICNTEPGEIFEMIEEGVIEYSGEDKKDWKFSYHSVERYRKATRLKNDLDLNLSGVALVLDLLDRI